MKRILIIEDETHIQRILADYLKSENFEILTAKDGATGFEFALNRNPDLIILDLMLPKKNGYDVCRDLRARNIATPIIMLTAKSDEVDKVLGLELGADDYVTKPFSLKEMYARIRALLRRVQTRDATPETRIRYEFGNMAIDFKSHTLTKKNKTTPLSAMEVKLLQYFAQHRGEVVTRNELLDKVWGYDRFPTTRTIDMHILNLRKKITQQIKL